ncbi:hypothetical protein RBH94_07815 [Aestuariibaculum sp. YM273]|uniref:alpha/beta hydrolase family protein n=1 Tax=Aestuariibaculum sp. YM273 TaxID=3070659 RepID=UPI0027DB7101|nr:hypothetical protein [Aestuariibaculum sp. YM273]WMI67048.1 hypothetical protein RBH94_07815 [Aestuariibaculum sp. YM273]
MLQKLTLLLISIITLTSCATKKTWLSDNAQREITFKTHESKSPVKDVNGHYLTIVYLENLGFEKLGGYTNSENVKWLLNEGYRVIELNYKKNPEAIGSKINKDIIAINNALAKGDFCGFTDCSIIQSYILFEGYRIKRNIPYFKDDPTVYNRPDQYTEGDMLNMDIIYPANPSKPVPTILSFSYSNSYATFDKEKNTLTNIHKNFRTFLPYTFAGFNDSFLEGTPAHGMAWAIADHPKYCSWGSGKPAGGPNDTYKSYETNPDTAQKVKSAIRTLRNLTHELELSENIGIYGFSRGSTAGSMAIGDKSVPLFENAGFNIGVSDDVQVAALGPGVFDYTQIYNTLDDGDGNLELRCPWAWGDLEDNYELWKSMGSEYLVETSSTAPVLFFYNTTDDAYYQDQIQHLKTKLDKLGVPNQTLTDYGTGHAVPQREKDLETLYTFFKQYLNPPTVVLKN